MKSATIPSVRIEPALREEIEQSLKEGESLSTFVEAAVRESVRRRQDQSEFTKRGIASLEAVRRGGPRISADSAIRKLEARLAKAKAVKARKATAAG